MAFIRCCFLWSAANGELSIVVWFVCLCFSLQFLLFSAQNRINNNQNHNNNDDGDDCSWNKTANELSILFLYMVQLITVVSMQILFRLWVPFILTMPFKIKSKGYHQTDQHHQQTTTACDLCDWVSVFCQNLLMH